MPDAPFAVEGALEPLSKAGTFVARHILTPLRGVAVHINAFNFPCWGMLEKLAPTLLAGVPVDRQTGDADGLPRARASFEAIIESGDSPQGAVQLIVGSLGDLLDQLERPGRGSFTGSARHRAQAAAASRDGRKRVRFIAERDSLNAAILGPDAGPGTPEFDLFVKEVVREMTVKAGQKCTAHSPRDRPARRDDAATRHSSRGSPRSCR